MFRFNEKTILIISPEPWGENFVSKHHYAIELSKDNAVYFLNPPSKLNQKSRISNSLVVVDYRAMFRGLGKLPSFLSSTLIRNELKRIEKLVGNKFDIIWNFDSSRFFNLFKITQKLKIAHLVDLGEYFQRPLLCKTSDICLCTSDAIAKEMKVFNDFTFNIGHGVQNPSGSIKLTSKERLELQNDFRFNAFYIGNLSSKYLDWQTIRKIACENTSVAFYFIGPLGKSNLSNDNPIDPFFNDVRMLPNTFFLGSRPSTKIISYLKESDVLIISYKANGHKQQLANPHKVLEYLASGKVLIASWTEEYVGKKDLFEMVDENEAMPILFKNVIANLRFYNSIEKQEFRQNFAKEHTYDRKINLIADLINSSLNMDH